MDQPAPPDGALYQVPQATSALWDEIASLHRQNEQRLASLRQSHSSGPAAPSTMHRFNDFPFEIRQMIWGYALPAQILGNQDIDEGHLVPIDLDVPAVGHVCRESRRFVESRSHCTPLPGAEMYGDLKPPSRERRTQPTPARWAWFAPSTDALMVNARGFAPSQFGIEVPDANHALARGAEHIIVEDLDFWREYHLSLGLTIIPMYDQRVDVLLTEVTHWVHKVYATPYSHFEAYTPTRPSICNLRTVDYSMREVTQIHPDCPPRFLRRLFGEATFRVVDLRDMDGFLRMLGHELSQGMDPDLFFKCSGELGKAWSIYKSVAKFFIHLRSVFQRALVVACFEASKKESSEGHGILPMPFKPGGFILNMEVTWVKELCRRLTIRPVHVFVLGKDMLEDISEN